MWKRLAAIHRGAVLQSFFAYRRQFVPDPGDTPHLESGNPSAQTHHSSLAPQLGVLVGFVDYPDGLSRALLYRWVTSRLLTRDYLPNGGSTPSSISHNRLHRRVN